MKHGYKITKIYSALKFKRYIGLMKKYIDFFIKIKIQNNGFLTPEQCNEINESHKKKNLDVHIKSEDTKSNPGMKALSKLCLNSLWGKFGQRSGLDSWDIYIEKKTKQDLHNKYYILNII